MGKFGAAAEEEPVAVDNGDGRFIVGGVGDVFGPSATASRSP
jgi:hypothetical protein